MDYVQILTGALGLLALAYPPAAIPVAVLTRALPYLVAAAPVVTALIKEGLPAFQAAQQAAPQLTSAIQSLAVHIPSSSGNPEKHLENVTRRMFGLGRMSPEEERRWMDQTTGGGDPNVGMSS
jgi:ABC-type uncharacterized transport system permease subunit